MGLRPFRTYGGRPHQQGGAGRPVRHLGHPARENLYGYSKLWLRLASPLHKRADARTEPRHEVWFEDARSIRTKLALAGEYQLHGISIWNIMRYFPQLWLVLNNLYEIEKLP